MSGAFSFLMNGFKYKVDGPLYNRTTSDPVGYFKASNMARAVPNLFQTANELKGDFIAQVFAEGLGNSAGGDLMFDPFLAAAKSTGLIQVNSEKYKPFLAIVNIPEITGIATPILNPDQSMSDRDFKAIRDITNTLGVFRKDNFFNQFAIPEYQDPVLVTFGDPSNLENPIFISPMLTGEINLNGKQTNNNRTTTVGIAKTGYYNQCRKAGKSKKKTATTPAPTPPTPPSPTAPTATPAPTPPTGAPPTPPSSGLSAAALLKISSGLGGKVATPVGSAAAPKVSTIIKGKKTGSTALSRGAALAAFRGTTSAATVAAATDLIFPIGAAATTRAELCKKASGSGGSLVGKQAGPFKIINKNSNGDFLVYNRDPNAIRAGVQFQKRPFAPLNIVLHDTAGAPGVAESLYASLANNSDGRGISSHYIIGEDGKVIETLNPLHYAGKHSAYGWNNFSIGIDMMCQAYLNPSEMKAHPRWTGDLNSYIGSASTTYLPVQPTSDPYPWNSRSNTDLSKLTPAYLTRRKNNSAGGKMFLDYTEPQKEALYGLITLLLKLFKNTISNRCVLIKDIGNSPNMLGNYPQAFSGVVAHTQIEDPARRGDGHRAIDLLVKKGILTDISNFDVSTFTAKVPGPYWDTRLK